MRAIPFRRMDWHTMRSVTIGRGQLIASQKVVGVKQTKQPEVRIPLHIHDGSKTLKGEPVCLIYYNYSLLQASMWWRRSIVDMDKANDLMVFGWQCIIKAVVVVLGLS